MRNVLLLSMLLLLPQAARATKPCDSVLCEDPPGVFSETVCAASADWVAVGRISEVRHDFQGPPLNKDFAEFTLIVTRWEKGQGPSDSLRFKVGWCDNQREIGRDSSGMFRFFGLGTPDRATGHSRYIDFQRLPAPD